MPIFQDPDKLPFHSLQLRPHNHGKAITTDEVIGLCVRKILVGCFLNAYMKHEIALKHFLRPRIVSIRQSDERLLARASNWEHVCTPIWLPPFISCHVWLAKGIRSTGAGGLLPAMIPLVFYKGSLHRALWWLQKEGRVHTQSKHWCDPWAIQRMAVPFISFSLLYHRFGADLKGWNCLRSFIVAAIVCIAPSYG